MSIYYVDMDGTLLSSELDKLFAKKVKEVGLKAAIEWYNTLYVANLAINWSLVNTLCDLKANGHTLVLWTDRSETQRRMTMDNLGLLWNLFSEHRFYDGAKKHSNVSDGHVFDNKIKFVNMGRSGTHVQW